MKLKCLLAISLLLFWEKFCHWDGSKAKELTAQESDFSKVPLRGD
jgi:hypothetical protein